MTNRTYFIYTLIDPRTQAVRYVGCTVDLKGRLSSHLYETGSSKKCLWINELKSLGLKPTMQVVETCYSIEDAAIKEKYHFDYFNSEDMTAADPKNTIYKDTKPNSPTRSPGGIKRERNIRQITIEDELYEKAKKDAEKLGISSFSAYVRYLIVNSHKD